MAIQVDMTLNAKTAVLGVVFPAVERFLDDYFVSLKRQTFKDFDLVLVNDGLDNLSEFQDKYSLSITEVKCSGTPAKIREFAINQIKSRGYQYLVFTDSDDVLSDDRITKSIELLRDNDVVVNDLTTISSTGKVETSLYITNRLKNNANISFDFIKDKNIFGFTNTSIRVDCIKSPLSFDEDSVAVDWYLFSMLLKQGSRAVFTNEAETFYRIYESNVIGISEKIDGQKIDTGVNVKAGHYKELAKIDSSFAGLCEEVMLLKNALKDDAYREDYITKIRNLCIENPLWWEQIKLPGELGL